MDLAMELLKQALLAKASDILLLPDKKGYQVKYYVSNHYEVKQALDSTVGQQLIAFFKFKDDMSLSEQRRPQLGAWHETLFGQEIYLRFSTVGDFLGRESLVIRIIYPLAPENYHYLVPSQWLKLRETCKQRGMIIFSGPMGSGKTSAMYHLARSLPQAQVMCIEDPIEIKEEKFLQIQVNLQAQMDYATLLKAALRHHPDIFIIGEIRDEKTAHAALTAALSGHLVLSTIHATSVYGVFSRLKDLGLSEEELKNALRLIVYQRLVPLKNKNQAVLFDLLERKTFLSEVNEHGADEMTKKWREYLEKSVSNGEITTETAEKFANG